MPVKLVLLINMTLHIEFYIVIYHGCYSLCVYEVHGKLGKYNAQFSNKNCLMEIAWI